MDLNAFYEAEFDQHQDALDATREALMEPFSQLIGICAEAIRAGNKLVLWRNFSKAERVQMGEILDARYTIAKTFAIFAQDISSARFYRDIANNEEWTWKKGEKPPEELIAKDESALRHYIGYEWVKVTMKEIPKTGGKTKWGDLSAAMFAPKSGRILASLTR